MSAQAARDDPATGPAGDEVIEPEQKALIRGADVDLAARDPEFIRRQLPLMWLISTQEATLVAERRMVEFDERIGARS